MNEPDDALQPNGVPLYLQLVERFERRILIGELREGDRLPAERDLLSKLLETGRRLSDIDVRR